MNRTNISIVATIVLATLSATVPAWGDTTTLLLDMRTEPQLADSIDITYDASWIGGDAGATVVISDNGMEVMRTTGAGEFTHTPTGAGRHELTYTTIIDGDAQEEVYRATIYKGKYTIHFDANGGEGEMEPFVLVEGTEQTLPESTFTKEGHFLIGWALTPDGDATLLDGDSTADIVAEAGETVTLYAVWHEGEGGGNGLSAKYYDISSSGYSTWTQSEAAMTNYFAAYTPTIETNTLEWGETLDAGICHLTQPDYNTILNSGLTGLRFETNVSGNRFSGKYGSQSADYFAAFLSGQIYVSETGSYSFAIIADDYDVLYIDGTKVCNSQWITVAKGTISLSAGWHRIQIGFYEGEVGHGLAVEWKKPGDSSYAPIPQSILSNAHPAYAVRFNANGGAGMMAKRVYASGDDVALPANAFTRDSWTFLGWGTEADGPVAYADGAAIDGGIDAANGETTTLYARWGKDTYTVNFDANGGEGAMADESFWLGIPDMLTPNDFTRTGYTFAGWATAAGGAVEHGDGALVTNLTETVDVTVNLYSVWSPNHYQVRFNSGSGTGSMPNQTITYDAATALSANTFAKTGYHFAGWATEADGEAVYGDCVEALNLAAGDGDVVDLYATWAPNGYTVVLDANGGAGTMADMQFTYDEDQALTANAFARASRFFAGWATAADGAVAYADGAVVSNLTTEANGEVRLYAVWADSRVVLDANGGEGSMGTFFVFSGTEQTLPQGTFTKEGCFLLGWALTPDGDATLLDGDSTADLAAQAGQAVTLYAVWHEGECGGMGLSVKYYDIASISDSNWHVQVDTYEECIAYHAAMTPTIVTNSFDIGDTLDFGDNNSSTAYFHGKYAQKGTENFVMLLEGTMAFEESGNYSFQTKHDDGCVFYMDGNAAYSRYNAGGWNTFSVDVDKGRHNVLIAMHEGGGGQSLRFQMKAPSWSSHSGLPQSVLSHGDSAYAIRFDANGGTGTMAKRVYAVGEDMTLPAMAFERDGWTFLGWGMEANGPVVFADEEAFEGGFDAANGETTTLYARWGKDTYTVHFDANGGNGVMADESFWFGIPDTLTPNAFTCTGYTFAGWATAADGDVAHGDGALVTNLTETADATVNLYAVWSPNHYQVRFNSGSGTGSMPNQTITYDVATALSANTFAKTGYHFVGWATEADGEAVYDDCNEALNLAAGEGDIVDLYATWAPNGYTVVFDANGGTRTMEPQQFTYDEEQALNAKTFVWRGHFFAGWAMAADGAVAYADGAVVSNLTTEANGEVRLYAVWADARIVFEANGGEGSMGTFFVFSGTEQTLPQGTFAMDGYFLLGWALTPNGDATLLDGDTTADIVADVGETMTLYAVWHEGVSGGNGLSVKYYDISSSGYSTWTQSEAAMKNYFAAYTPTIETNTLDWGEGLDAGYSSLPSSSVQSSWRSAGLTIPPQQCKFHGKYADASTKGFAAAMTGFLRIDTAGTYRFAGVADDTVVLYVNGEMILKNEEAWERLAMGEIALSAGHFPVSIAFREHDTSGGQGLSIQWKKPGDSSYAPIPQSFLFDGDQAYAVRFDANGGEGTMAKRVYAAGEDMALPAMAFERDGWTFVGWGTEADGPVVFADEEAFEGGFDAANGETVTLYARWSRGQYAVHFDANGGDGTMADESLWLGVPATLDANGFSRTGYAFGGWTLAGGDGTMFADGALVTDLAGAVGATVTLQAIWTPNEYAIALHDGEYLPGLKATYYDIPSITYADWHDNVNTYDKCLSHFAALTPTIVTNSADIGETLDFGRSDQTAHYHGKYSQQGANNFTILLEGNINICESGAFAFKVWHDDGCVVYIDGSAAYSHEGPTGDSWQSFSCDLFAGWHEVVVAQHEKDGGQGLRFQMQSPSDITMAGLPQSILSHGTPPEVQLFTYDAAQPLWANTFAKTGYTFAGWATEQGGEAAYADGAVVSNLAAEAGSVIDLYATWASNNYAVRFDANGGEGTMADQPFSYDEAAALSASAFTRANHFFAGWATEEGGAAEYADGAVVSNLTAVADDMVTLHAVWADGRVLFDANGGEGEMETFLLFAGVQQTLPPCAFTNTNGFFLGWALTADGEATLLDGDTTADLAADAGETVTLYAVWHEGERDGMGLSVKYYDIASISDSNWHVQVDTYEECIAYHAAMTPTIVTNSFDIGDTLDFGDNNSSKAYFHGKYAQYGTENFVMLLEGTMAFEESGNYSFQTKHDDGCVFYMDGNAVYSRYNAGGWNTFSVDVDKGRHDVLIAMHEGGGGQSLRFQMKAPSWSSYSSLPQSILSHGDSAYAVRFDANGGTGMMAKRVYAMGDDIVLPANVFTRDGWSFLGWATSADGLVAYADGEAIDGGIDAANGATVTLYARWVEEAEIRFNANGGAGSMASQSFPIGYPFDLAINGFSRVGYSFAGWATEPDGDAAYWDGETITIDAEKGDAVDLFAVWTPNGYEVSFDPTEGAFAGTAPTLAAVFDLPYGGLPVASRTGYSLAWTLGGEAVTAETICTTPSNHTLVASWTPNEYEVSFDANGGEVGTASKTVTFGTAYGALPTPSFEWHSFRRWTLNGNRTISAESVVSTAADHTLVADWNLGIGGGAWAYPDGDGPITLGAPLAASSGDVVIPAEIDGRPIVAIEEAAFAGNTAITSIVVPESVTNIADGAFAGCTGLRSVAIGRMYADRLVDLFPNATGAIEVVAFGDGIEAIPDNFFEGCTALKSMDIPDSVVDIGTNVFEACSELAVCVTNGLRMYQGWCLGFAEVEGVEKVEDLVVPESYIAGEPPAPRQVRGIAAGAFEGETGIATVSLPEALVFIGARAFMGCTRLEGIAVPEGVAKIDREAFRNGTMAQGLSLPKSLLIIGDGAFANCTRFPGVSLPLGVEEIGGCAFSNCWRVTSVSIPQSVERIGVGAFADCENITEATVPLHVKPVEDLFPKSYWNIETLMVAPMPDDASDDFMASRQMVEGIFEYCESIQNMTLPDWVMNVSRCAFFGCGRLRSLSLPDCVTNISDLALCDMYILSSFKFPSSLVSIGELAFNNCSDLSSIDLPDGLASIGRNAFCDLSLLTRVDIPASVRAIGSGAFAGCGAVRAVSMPGDVGTVAAIFPDAYQLITSATVISSVETSNGQIVGSSGEDGSLGELAPPVLCAQLFAGCSALTMVELPQDLAEIGEQAFANCSALSEVGIPAAVTNIGASAFQNCSTLSSIALPKNLEVLQDSTFAGCTSLAGITIPEGVGALGNGVFSGCTLLRSVRFVGNAPSYSTASGGPYAGVPSDAVSYVPDGSTGWDGIAFSQDLPRYWPNGTTYRIDWWDPIRLTVAFDPCDGTAPVEVEQVTGTTYALPENPARQGATFGGWWTSREGGERVSATTRVTETRPQTLFAHWTMNRYFIHLDANGGSGTASPVEMTVGTAAALPQCPFAYVAHAFMGWATTPDGSVVYSDGATVCDLAYANNAAVTLYAVWAERDWAMPDYLDTPGLTFESEGGLEWSGDWEEFKVGGASLTSGELPPSEIEGEWTNTVLRTTVLGEGSLSFWWKVSCEPEDEDYGEWYDFATFSVDGVEVAIIAGESGWRQVECAVSGAGTHVLEWAFFRDDYDDDGADYDNALWVDGVEWAPAPVTVAFAAGVGANGETPTGDVPAAVTQSAGYALVLPGCGTLDNAPYVFMGWTDGETVYAAGDTYVFGSADVTLTAVWELKTWTLAESVDAEALVFTTGGTTDWAVDAATGWTNGVSAKSGAVASGESSWIEATVTGGGTLSFRWKVMGGIYRNNPFAYAKVEVDGTQIASTHLTDGWEGQTLTVEGAGTHTIRWTYLRTSARTTDGDCAWLDDVSWEAEEAAAAETTTTPEPVPYSWLDDKSAAILAANGGDYEAAANATAQNGRTVWECYVADLDPEDEDSDLVAEIAFDENGKPVVSIAEGESANRKYTTQGARSLGGEVQWDDLEEGDDWAAQGYRFFRIKVELP